MNNTTTFPVFTAALSQPIAQIVDRSIELSLIRALLKVSALTLRRIRLTNQCYVLHQLFSSILLKWAVFSTIKEKRVGGLIYVEQ